MKPAAYILIVMMLFLNLQPLLVNCQMRVVTPEIRTTCNGSRCCSEKETEDTEKKSEEHSEGCNPFAGCSQCQYLASYKIINLPKPAPVAKTRLFTASEDLQQGFITDCWHPPESVFTL
jgi:hypothetical protein